MTIQEAINQLTAEQSYIEDIPGSDKTVKAIDMAIEALEKVDNIETYYKRLNNIRIFEYYCPRCGTKMREVTQ